MKGMQYGIMLAIFIFIIAILVTIFLLSSVWGFNIGEVFRI